MDYLSRNKRIGADTPFLLALDWGTSSVRAYLLGKNGVVLDSHLEPWGVMHTPGDNFSLAFEILTGKWRKDWPNLPAIASGMIGSAQGWKLAPYCPCPCTAEDLANELISIVSEAGSRLHIVPGIISEGDNPDVIRGEETQIIGSIALMPELAENAVFILPGTHSKWAKVEEGKIVDFKTYMTGELFSAISEHTILGRPAREALSSEPKSDGMPQWDAFDRGVKAIQNAGNRGLSYLLFSTRSLVLTKMLRPEDSLEYLSGLLIAEEVRCAAISKEQKLTITGEQNLCERYGRALTSFGLQKPKILENPSANGLWKVAKIAGLV